MNNNSNEDMYPFNEETYKTYEKKYEKNISIITIVIVVSIFLIFLFLIGFSVFEMSGNAVIDAFLISPLIAMFSGLIVYFVLWSAKKSKEKYLTNEFNVQVDLSTKWRKRLLK